MSEKKVQAKGSIVIGLILTILAFLLPQTSSALSTKATIEVAAASQAANPISADQLVIASVTVKDAAEQSLLQGTGQLILAVNGNNQVFLQLPFAKLQELQQAGWSLTLLYIRGAGDEGRWKAAPDVFADCSGAIDADHESFPGSGGFSSFNFMTNSDCEWTILTDVSWVHVGGTPQGTGSTTVHYSVDVNPTTSRRVGDIFIAGQVFTVYQGRDFADVPTSHPFYVAIGKLSARGITSGCSDNNFCPSNPLRRDEMSAFIIRSIGEFNPPTPATQRFTDVPPSNQFYNFIDRLAALGITTGCTPTQYCPADPVLRQQMAAFIIRALGEPNPPTPATQRFVDVPPSNPFYSYIDRLAALGITQGCSISPPMYCPTDIVTRGQAAVFLSRAFNL